MIRASLHAKSTEAVEVRAHQSSDWLEIGGDPCFCDDADTAERVARGFMELAKKMRERRALPDSEDEWAPVTLDGGAMLLVPDQQLR